MLPSEPTALQRAACPRPRTEVLTTAIIGSLFAERRVPQGAVVNAGAHYGNWACYYALFDLQRSVYAVEPNSDRFAAMRKKYTMIPNLLPLLGGLGKAPWNSSQPTAELRRLGEPLPARVLLPPEQSDLLITRVSMVEGVRLCEAAMHPRVVCTGFSFFFKRSYKVQIPPSWRVHTLDELFRSEKLGFVHLDVERFEEEVLRGGRCVQGPNTRLSRSFSLCLCPHTYVVPSLRRVMARDRPLLVIEIEVHSQAEATRSVLNYVNSIG